MSLVYTKSAKGSREAGGRTSDLPEELRELLKRCRGRFTVASLCAGLPESAHSGIADAIARLVEDGYLREVPDSQLEGSPPGTEEDLDSDETADSQDVGGDLPSIETDPDDRVDDTAEKLRAGMAKRREERNENATALVRQFDEEARRKAEEKAARLAEDEARRAAEEQARREAEEHARRQAEEEARRAAEEAARRQAEEARQRAEEEERRRAEEERQRKAAERKAAEEARERARLEEEERDRRAIQERLRKRRERQQRVLWPTLFGIVLPVVAGLLFLQFHSFDGRRADFEKAASDILGVPVKAGSSKLWFAPGPQWRFDNVVAGVGAEQARIARVSLNTSLGGVFGPARFDAIHLEDLQLPGRVAARLIQGSSASTALGNGELRATRLSFTDVPKDLPPLDLKASFRDGQVAALTMRGATEDAGKVDAEIQREGGLPLRLEASQLRWLFGPGVPLSDVRLKGRLDGGAIVMDEFVATLYAGELAGSGRLSWDSGWRLAAKLDAKHVEAERLVKGWIREGLVAGSLNLVAAGATPVELASNLQLAGRFSLERGLLAGVDIDKVVQGRGLGDETRFESLTGDFTVESGRVEVVNLKVAAQGVKAAGAVRVERDRSVSGRLSVEAEARGVRGTTLLQIGGTHTAPNYQR